MKTYTLFIAIFFCLLSASAQRKTLQFDRSKKVYELPVSCGTCMFKMKGSNCLLAVEFNKQYYFVSGTSIDDHGDAHAANGFCNAIRKAKVQGEIKHNKFVATYFQLLKPKI